MKCNNIHLEKSGGFKWVETDGTYIKGYFFDHRNNEYFSSNNNLTGFTALDSQCQESLLRDINKLNGCFSIVHVMGELLYAAVDRLRCHPLYYYNEKGKFYLSDEIEWILRKIDEVQINELCKTEFTLTGYVTGNDTMINSVKQLKAGELLIYNFETGEIELERYFEHRHSEQSIFNICDLVNELDNNHVKVFEKLIETLEGRQVVVPLSGGHDSRLIAIMLRRLGYKNVITFTYGIPNNRESNISQEVAKELNYEWHFIEYNNAKWKEYSKSIDFNRYIDYAGEYSSLAHIQDFIAVYELKSKGLISSDAIFIPGHSYDFLAGSHIPPWFMGKTVITNDELIKVITDEHYKLWGKKSVKKQDYRAIIKRIEDQMGNSEHRSINDAADALECWDWQERQSKFICNSVRVYDYWGFEWRLPLWDYNLILYWSKIPIELRVGRKLYFEYVKAKQSIGEAKKNTGKRNALIRLFNKLMHKRIKIELHRMKNILFDQMGWFGTYDTRMKVKYVLNSGSHVNSGLALKYLNRIDQIVLIKNTKE